MENTIGASEGSRIWGAFKMEWKPEEAQLTVTVSVGGSSSNLSQVILTPDNASAPIDGDNGQYQISGNVVAAFEADGQTGTLRTDAEGLKFDSPNVHGQYYAGLIGAW